MVLPDVTMGSRPTFPTYLLPSFKVPFRRRGSRGTATTAASSSTTARIATTDASDTGSRTSCDDGGSGSGSLPSLSSSPGSSLASTPAGSPPPFFAGYYFPNIDVAAKGREQQQQQPHQQQPPRYQYQTIERRRVERTHPDTLRCGYCSVDLAFTAQIVSKGFTGRHGRAFLVSPPSALGPLSSSNKSAGSSGAGGDLVNVRVGRPENRQLVTGAHVVADISCVVCGTKLGWKYVDAKDQSQKYKVGKFILETQRVVAYRSWEDAVSAAPETEHVDTAKGVGKAKKQKNKNKKMKLNKARLASSSSDYRSSSSSDDSSDSDTNHTENDYIVFDSDDDDECEDIFAGTWDPDVVARRRGRKFGARRKHGSE
jgi:hypothetical protein